MAKKLAILDLKETNTTSGFVGLGAKAGRIFQKVGTVETLLTLEGHSHSWSQVTGKPATFAPSTHSHAWADITSKPATFAPSSHNHPTTDITGLGNIATINKNSSTANYLRGDGTWVTPPNTTYGVATTGANGLMSSSDKSKLNNIASNANNYSLPTASSTTLGGVKIGSNISILSGVISVAAPYSHPSSHPATMITGLHTSATTGVAGSVAWGNVTGKPSTFAPTTHTHSNITITAGTGLSGGGALSASRTLSIASTYAPNTSTSLGASKNLNNYQTAGFYHQTSNANATTALNYPVASAGALLVETAAGVIQTYKVYNSSNVYVRGYYGTTWTAWIKLVNTSDSIPWARITGAPATATTHPTWAQVTGKPSTFAPSSHTHTWAQVTSKPSTFAPSAHTLNSHSNVTITSIASGEILKWNGTAWVNNTLAEAGISASSHSHSWSSITSKPSSFTPSSHSHSWSSITSKPNSLSGFGITDATTLTEFNALKNLFNSMFEIDGTMIKAKKPLYSVGEITAFGKADGSGATGGGTTVHDGLTSNATDVALSANQGRLLNLRLQAVENSTNLIPTHLSQFTNDLTTFPQAITVPAIYKASDIGLKKDIKNINSEKIDGINLIEFVWKETNQKDYGVIAQELKVEYPELVREDSEGIMQVNYESLYALKIARLEQRIKELESKKCQH